MMRLGVRMWESVESLWIRLRTWPLRRRLQKLEEQLRIELKILQGLNGPMSDEEKALWVRHRANQELSQKR